MNRRMFLAGASGAAVAFAQGRGRGPGVPAGVPAAKLARVSIMTYNFRSILKFPWTKSPTEAQTLSILDLPQMYQDVYGVNHVEFQHDHLVDTSGNRLQAAPDPEFFREVRGRLDAAKSIATQINIEIGVIPNLTGEARAAWIASAKRWVDAAPILGVPRLMLNQTGLVEDTKANTISVWKEIQDYARPKGIRISGEGRGTGVRNAQPPADPKAACKAAYTLLASVIEGAGGYSNVDLGNAGAPDQQSLHDAIKALHPTSSGNMHIKSSPNWDIGAAVRFSESLGYRGHYSIEVDGHQAIRQVYNLIVPNVSNQLAE